MAKDMPRWFSKLAYRKASQRQQSQANGNLQNTQASLRDISTEVREGVVTTTQGVLCPKPASMLAKLSIWM